MVASADPDLLATVDRPLALKVGRTRSDKVFRTTVLVVAALVLLIFGSIGGFLASKVAPTFQTYGLKFLTSSTFDIGSNKIGISSTILGTFKVALVSLVVAFPLALSSALYISEFAPVRIRSFLVNLVDVMAAVPSVIIGAWGLLVLMPQIKYLARFMAQYLAWIPLFRVGTPAGSATWAESQFVNSPFVAGIVVAMMVIPIAASVMLGVFSQAPKGEREAAYALGATRWGMIRTVVLPFGRGGIIGGTMLGLGRALGETIAVLLVLSLKTSFNFRLLQSGFSTISSLIANTFGDASKVQLDALFTAGLVLFFLTLIVNTIAGVIVSRSRSGAATEI